MAALHEALKCLTPTNWGSVPSDPSDLRTYINEISTKARLIVDSVPEPPPTDDQEHHNHTGNGPSPSSQMRPSTARYGTTDEPILSLQREWGKPIKINSAKDNPLDIPVYKLPGIDGNGHWFSRRSVHEGLPFSTWQRKLSSEMAETLKANQERVSEGKPADQSVRGIGAEKRVEDIEVLAGSADNGGGGKKVVGNVDLLHVSAQFPKPTTPRDFVTMIITWETEVDTANGGGGRTWMMVSRPCEHPDVPPNQGFIRGQYESVEFIREIPVKGNRSSGDGEEDGDEESWYPVEWIMVTRSDPGGNIPRWMVEKGTPRSICSDAVKFLGWACQDLPRRQTNRHLRQASGKSEISQPTTAGDDMSDAESTDTDITEPEPQEHHGLIASLGYLVNAGLERYAPQAVLDYIPRHVHHPSAHYMRKDAEKISLDSREVPRSVPDDSSNFVGEPAKDAEIGETRSQDSANSGRETPGEINLDITPADIIHKKGKLSSHEKQLAKLAQQKRNIEAQLELTRTDIQSLRLRPSEEETRRERAAALGSVDNPSTERVSSSPSSSVTDHLDTEHRSSSNPKHSRHGAPTREAARMDKVASNLFHEESKLLRQLGKIEKQQLKEAMKIEAHQRKEAERKEKSHSRNENEYLRREVESLKKELEKIKGERRKWLDLIGSLQTENKALAKQIAEGQVK